MNADLAQADQAQKKLETAADTVRGRIPECYQWLLVPGQGRPVPGEKFPPVDLQEIRLPQGQEALAVRASKRLTRDELLMVSMAGERLFHEIEEIPLWSGELNESIGVKQLVELFTKYLYLPRIKNSQVLVDAIQDGANKIPGVRILLPMLIPTIRSLSDTEGWSWRGGLPCKSTAVVWSLKLTPLRVSWKKILLHPQ